MAFGGTQHLRPRSVSFVQGSACFSQRSFGLFIHIVYQYQQHEFECVQLYSSNTKFSGMRAAQNSKFADDDAITCVRPCSTFPICRLSHTQLPLLTRTDHKYQLNLSASCVAVAYASDPPNGSLVLHPPPASPSASAARVTAHHLLAYHVTPTMTGSAIDLLCCSLFP